MKRMCYYKQNSRGQLTKLIHLWFWKEAFWVFLWDYSVFSCHWYRFNICSEHLSFFLSAYTLYMFVFTSLCLEECDGGYRHCVFCLPWSSAFPPPQITKSVNGDETSVNITCCIFWSAPASSTLSLRREPSEGENPPPQFYSFNLSPFCTSFLWISERSFSMLHMVSDILGCRLLGSPICGFFSYTSFILFRASLIQTNKSWLTKVKNNIVQKLIKNIL